MEKTWPQEYHTSPLNHQPASVEAGNRFGPKVVDFSSLEPLLSP
jgi:hypothetical protein